MSARRAVDPHVVVAEVVGTRRVTPSMVRVTLGGEGVGLFTATGFDQWFRLFLPRDGQGTLRLPTRTSSLWYVQYLATPKAQRPHVRAYTVRDARPAQQEIDVDFVVHLADDVPTGPAVAFALTAEPGQQVGLLDQGHGFGVRHDHDSVLLVCDETGLPAVARICESLPADARGLALIEVPTAMDVQEFRAPDGVEVRWLPRDEGDEHERAVPGRLALARLPEVPLPGRTPYAHLIGESALATGARRHLVTRCGVPKAHIGFAGYWRHGHAAQ
ncbi:siderophore-interacting protein [Actinotalea sp. C106]|uniref:siderophore-interacting protein n=1 Tax=Actinotalea sp. C106 TaxID=2908644 RepID=UPI0020277546|nr:siderophore-interacting protein [Actinotalea sp. C106]